MVAHGLSVAGSSLVNAAKNASILMANNEGWSKGSNTESPALKDSPYNPDVVDARVKPPYKANPAHDKGSHLYNPKKTPEPTDAAQVYENAVLGKIGTWYGKNSNGQLYQYFSDGTGGVHFAGTVTKEKVPNEVLKQLGIKY